MLAPNKYNYIQVDKVVMYAKIELIVPYEHKRNFIEESQPLQH